MLRHLYTVRVRREFAENRTVVVGAETRERALKLAMRPFADALEAAILLDEVQPPC